MTNGIDPEWKAEDTITPSEDVLNWLLRSHAFNFERQYEVKRPDSDRSYWLDFAWPREMVAIEIDGHPVNLERESFLTCQGWRILHVQNEHFTCRKTAKDSFESILVILLYRLRIELREASVCPRCGKTHSGPEVICGACLGVPA